MRDALISINFICNLRCRMCGVWKNPDAATIDPHLYTRLPAGLRKITLTGGEIFLDPGLGERLRVIADACPKARIILITNGSLPNAVGQLVRGVGVPIRSRLGFRVSLDGPPEVHDAIRGKPGAHASALETIRVLQRDGVSDIGISFTLQPANQGSAAYVMDLARQHGLDFVCNLVQNSNLAYGACHNAIQITQLESELRDVVRREIQSRHWKQWFRAYFAHRMIEYHKSGYRGIPCDAGRNSFFLNHDGGVYACNILDDCLGSIAQASVLEIFANPEVRRRMASLGDCQACWTSCNASEAMRRHPWPMLKWVFCQKMLPKSVAK